MSSKFNFCTLFDRNYLAKGLALYHSLQEHTKDFKLFVLCLDKSTLQFFESKNYENLIAISLVELESFDHRIIEAKGNRSLIEFYFTLSPFLPLFILNKYPDLPSICSLDSDILFFSSPESIFKHLEKHSIIITPHKYSEKLLNLKMEIHGIYNVSFQIFKNNSIGLKCLKNWADECFEWCHDYLDEITGKYADQKYLDSWEFRYPNEVYSLNDPATGLAPWNLDNYQFSLKGSQVMVNDIYPLIFYHFHHFKILNFFVALNGFAFYQVENYSTVLKDNIYLKYWMILNKYKIRSKDNVIRGNFKKNVVSLVIVHKTSFFKFLYKSFQIDCSIVHNFAKKILNR